MTQQRSEAPRFLGDDDDNMLQFEPKTDVNTEIVVKTLNCDKKLIPKIALMYKFSLRSTFKSNYF